MIYSPPKNNTGKTVSLLGSAASAIAPLTGPAAPFVMAAGGIASLIGGVVGANEEEKLNKYNALYQEKMWQLKLMAGGKNRKLAIKKAKDNSVQFLKRQFG